MGQLARPGRRRSSPRVLPARLPRPARPDRRHHRASIGHAVSTDLRSWRRSPTRSSRRARRAGTTWPPGRQRRARPGPPVVPVLHRRQPGRDGPCAAHRTRHLRRPDGLAPTGTNPVCRGRSTVVRTPRPGRTGTSRPGATPGSSPTRRATAGTCSSPPEPTTVPPSHRGVIGHARSSDLVNWTVQPPLSSRPASATSRCPRSPSSTGSRCCSSAPTPSPRTGRGRTHLVRCRARRQRALGPRLRPTVPASAPVRPSIGARRRRHTGAHRLPRPGRRRLRRRARPTRSGCATDPARLTPAGTPATAAAD